MLIMGHILGATWPDFSNMCSCYRMSLKPAANRQILQAVLGVRIAVLVGVRAVWVGVECLW